LPVPEDAESPEAIEGDGIRGAAVIGAEDVEI